MSLSISTMYQEYFEVYPLQRIVAYVIATLLPFVALWLAKAKSEVPILNPKRRFEATSSRVRQEFIADSIEIMKAGRALYPHEPYRAYTDFGNVLVLPPELLPELKSHPNLDFLTPAQDDGHAYVPGFEPFGVDNKTPFVITKYLTKALTKLTRALSKEATFALRESLTDSPAWHEINPARDILSLISRLSSRVFMGEDLCRNKDWIEASSKYTAMAFSSGDTLRQWSRPLRPIVHWFLSDCRETRRQLNVARSVLRPLLEQRQIQKREAEARGETPSVFNDSLEWFEKEYSKGYDPATS
ncbi:hypothetical protein PFICI_02977 [Pestalotiopsis fici W106-1]|uniref:Uncharacterized protein n=1 Tax=Pestalotiopsis fici (strain W106-1 / CGMCC3.15140) TaxID=1229662 RepID=W3XHN3_PESFW|nr:uncharacterized protein PFICI_02977 [Pestalotiopsis fici W106-1]ETS84952.1 hypothetical protein PFICI_02977 [Pestalotiopsis fici W106-1]